MSVVRIPPVLRAATGGEREITVDGATVADVLDALYDIHPAVRTQLQTPEGDLHKFVNVYLNDEDVRLLSWLDTEVTDGDTLLILPAMAGGDGRLSRKSAARPPAANSALAAPASTPMQDSIGVGTRPSGLLGFRSADRTALVPRQAAP